MTTPMRAFNQPYSFAFRGTFLLLLLTLVVPIIWANDEIGSNEDVQKLLEKGEFLLSKNGHERLHAIDSTIATHLHLADSQNRIRYYLFKGGFSQKLMEYEASKRYYEKALGLTENWDYRNLAIGNFGISMYHKHVKNTAQQESYLLKSYRYAKMARDGFWTLHAALGLASLSESRKEFENTKAYLSECIAIDSSNSAVRLRRANFFFSNDRFRLGMEDLWEVVQNDPKFENQVTMYALFRVVTVHIEMGSFEKAREILRIVLENPEKYDKKVLAYNKFYEGVLLYKEGHKGKARIRFLEALHSFGDKSLQANVMRYLFLLDREQWHPNYLSDLIAKGMLFPEFEDSHLGIMIRLVLESQSTSVDSKRRALDRALVFLREQKALSLTHRLWLLDQLNDANVKLHYREREMQAAMDSLRQIERRNKQTLVDNYVYVNNKFFNKRIAQGQQLLNEKEEIIAQEKKTNSLITRVALVMFLVLLIISALLWKIFRDRNKIKKLNEVVLAKNLSLQRYSKEYEDLLMILGHQVKNPINQLHYSFAEILERTKPLKDTDLDFILSTVTNNTEELSNRIKIILTLIKCRIEDIAITTTRVNLYKLIQERLRFFESCFSDADLRFNFEVDKTLSTEINVESLAIIFDNLFENIRKYGVPGNEVHLRLVQTSKGIVMEIENTYTQQLQKELIRRKRGLGKSSYSFGLGNRIIQALCERLKIDFEFVQLQHTYATRLVFRD